MFPDSSVPLAYTVLLSETTTGLVYAVHVPLAPSLYSLTAASAGKPIVTMTPVLVGVVIFAVKVASIGG
ncbi:hypothetical protein [Paenibacillus alginolyticus]|uniref:hypothetical protein n=1 Tax=Paenibacillus alginolyticus TaxID=59839 RepID=UPI001566EB87|nr:hypothetical protein [Paenibacillus frigoriresistens]